MKTPKKINQMELISTCEGININEWNNLMHGATKANGVQIRRLIKKHLPDLYEALCLNFKNPFEHQSKKKENLFIYVHSAIEYFIRFE